MSRLPWLRCDGGSASLTPGRWRRQCPENPTAMRLGMPCRRLLPVTSSYLAGGGRCVLETPLPCGGGVGQSGRGGGHGDCNGTGKGSGSLKEQEAK